MASSAAVLHAVLRAFGWGAHEVLDGDTAVTWEVDPTKPPCPDCEDNALAGSQPAREPIPTLHRHAPAGQVGGGVEGMQGCLCCSWGGRRPRSSSCTPCRAEVEAAQGRGRRGEAIGDGGDMGRMQGCLGWSWGGCRRCGELQWRGAGAATS